MMKKLIAYVGTYVGDPKPVEPVRVPKRRGDVGYDLCAAADVDVLPGRICWVPTGVAIDSRFPLWYLITARSSLHKRNMICPIGIIDAGYQGELVVPVVTLSGLQQKIEKGEYIAQAIFLEVIQPKLICVDEFVPSERGDRGFGSTDKKT